MNRREILGAAVAIGGAAALKSTSAEAAAAPVALGPTHVAEEAIHGRNAFVIQNSLMRVGVLTGGGWVAEVSLVSKDPRKNVNPMRNPHYQTIDPYTYDEVTHAALYGTGMSARQNSGYMGQFTAFPYFVGSSKPELAQGLGQHGELITRRWERQPAEAADQLRLTVDLPTTQFGYERRVEMPVDETVAYFTETAENMAKFDRPAQWVQHTAFGPPFCAIGKMMADASVKNVVIGRGADAKTTTFPTGDDGQGKQIDYRPFRGASGLWLMQQENPKNWFTLYNTDLDMLIGYVYESAENPWLLDFQENMRNTSVPWDGKTVMRGLCFGETSIGGLRAGVTQASNMGVPTFRWFDARGKRSKRFAIFMTPIPRGFKGVASLEAVPGTISFTEKETGNRTTVKASKMW